jgi:hypothetical protein
MAWSLFFLESNRRVTANGKGIAMFSIGDHRARNVIYKMGSFWMMSSALQFPVISMYILVFIIEWSLSNYGLEKPIIIIMMSNIWDSSQMSLSISSWFDAFNTFSSEYLWNLVWSIKWNSLSLSHFLPVWTSWSRDPARTVLWGRKLRQGSGLNLMFNSTKEGERQMFRESETFCLNCHFSISKYHEGEHFWDRWSNFNEISRSCQADILKISWHFMKPWIILI